MDGCQAINSSGNTVMSGSKVENKFYIWKSLDEFQSDVIPEYDLSDKESYQNELLLSKLLVPAQSKRMYSNGYILGLMNDLSDVCYVRFVKRFNAVDLQLLSEKEILKGTKENGY